MTGVIYRHDRRGIVGCALKHFGLPCDRRHYKLETERPICVVPFTAGSFNSETWHNRTFRRDYEMRAITDPAEFGGYRTRPYITGRVGYYADRTAERIDRCCVVLRDDNCSLCGEPITARQYWRESRGKTVCSNCFASCDGCHRFFKRSALTRLSSGEFCRDCVVPCQGCDDCTNLIGRGTWQYSRGQLCDDCVPRCDNCGQELGDDEECSNCVNGQLEGYHHTHAHSWLGGNTAPYYLGFELEISADRYNPRTKYVKDWAENNLGDTSYISCKHDGSVDGYEIVSQPMTPEFFESMDWESFFDALENVYLVEREPSAHGLHVHISRSAFPTDSAMAAFAYLLAKNSQHLERISRRCPTRYCERTYKPVSEAIATSQNQREKYTKQYRAIYNRTYITRGAINFSNTATIEIRAGKSTRNAHEFKGQVRLVYVAAEYIRSLHFGNAGLIPAKALEWNSFVAWIETSKFAYFHNLAKGN